MNRGGSPVWGSFADHVADIQKGDNHSFDFVFQGAIGSDTKLVGLSIPGPDLLGPHGHVAHHIQHPALELRDVDVQRDMGECLAHIEAGETEYALGFSGKSPDV